MGFPGFATPEGTQRYRDRLVAAGTTHPHHFRTAPGGLTLSSIGLGTYLGGDDAKTDALYLSSVKQAVRAGCNVVDSAINYRCQRSERVIGQALSDLFRGGSIKRDEIILTTKGGYIPFDNEPARDPYAYLQQTFVMRGVIGRDDLVADCHCMAPTYLRNQLNASLANLGLNCVDVYYLHNPETQLDHVTPEEFLKRMRAAFEVLELAAAEGKLRMYGAATWNGYRVLPGSRGHISLEALVKLAEQVGGPEHHFKVIQLPYNLGMTEALAHQTQIVSGSKLSVLEAAKALDLYVMASASLLQGQLSDDLPSDVREALGDGTDAQRSIQFARSTPGLGTALIGMKQAAHVTENLAVAARAPLSPEQFTQLFK